MDTLSVEQIIQGGAVGISVALIILVGFIVRWILRLVGNHINSNTKILTQLSGKIDQDISAQKETSGVLRDLKEAIKK